MPREIKEYSDDDEIFINNSINCLKAKNKFNEDSIIDATCNAMNMLNQYVMVNLLKNYLLLIQLKFLGI